MSAHPRGGRPLFLPPDTVIFGRAGGTACLDSHGFTSSQDVLPDLRGVLSFDDPTIGHEDRQAEGEKRCFRHGRRSFGPASGEPAVRPHVQRRGSRLDLHSKPLPIRSNELSRKLTPAPLEKQRPRKLELQGLVRKRRAFKGKTEYLANSHDIAIDVNAEYICSAQISLASGLNNEASMFTSAIDESIASARPDRLRRGLQNAVQSLCRRGLNNEASMFTSAIDESIASASLTGCDEVSRTLWKAYAGGVIADPTPRRCRPPEALEQVARQ